VSAERNFGCRLKNWEKHIGRNPFGKAFEKDTPHIIVRGGGGGVFLGG